MVGEPRGSEPLTVGLPSGFGPVEMVEELQVFFFSVDAWMEGWMDTPEPNLTGFLLVPAVWFSLKVLYTPEIS